MNTLQYRDYQGSVIFEDGTLVIQVLHIDDDITTTCDSASNAQSAFEELVDDYIETCRTVGKEPSKPFKGTFNIRIGSVLHRNAAMAAADADDTLNAWIAGAVEQRLRRDTLLKAIKNAYQGEGWGLPVGKVPHQGAGFVRVGEAVWRETSGPITSHVDAGKMKAQKMLEMDPSISQWRPAREYQH